jgi:hypothetical protein
VTSNAESRFGSKEDRSQSLDDLEEAFDDLHESSHVREHVPVPLPKFRHGRFGFEAVIEERLHALLRLLPVTSGSREDRSESVA